MPSDGENSNSSEEVTIIIQDDKDAPDWIPSDKQLHDIVSRAIEKFQVSSLEKHEPSIDDKSNDKESFVCHMPSCRRNFTRAASLKSHFVWHQGKINFACSHCNKGFERKDTFLSHVQSHTSTKQKNKYFTRKRQAAAASNNIENVPKLACSIEGCERSYQSIKLLDAHIRYQHGAKTHACTWPSCSKKFTSNCSLRKHMKTHCTEEDRTCPYCNKRYNRKGFLNKHIISRHEDIQIDANV